MERETKKITVETIVNAPIEKVWDYWNAPEHITKWCHASEDWHSPYADNDLRESGTFKTTMAAKDGSFSFDFGGVYTAIQEHSVIQYKMEDGREVSIHFYEDHDNTKVIETFDPEEINPREMQQGGWQAILDNFKKYTEEN